MIILYYIVYYLYTVDVEIISIQWNILRKCESFALQDHSEFNYEINFQYFHNDIWIRKNL